MALALPDGYLDTGQSLSIGHSGQMRVRMIAGGVGFDVPNLVNQEGDDAQWFIENATVQQDWVSLNDFKVSGWYYTGGPPDAYVAAVLEWPGGGAKRLEGAIISTDEWPVRFSAWFSYTETLMGLRLGRQRLLDPELEETPFPVFDQLHMIERYRWFGDRNTSKECTLSGGEATHTVTLYLQEGGTWSTTQAASEFTPIDFGITAGGLLFQASIAHATSPPDAQFQNLSVSGNPVNTSGLSNGIVVGTGGGAAETTGNGGGGGTAWPPTILRREFRPQLYFRGPSDRTDADCTLYEPNLGSVTGPYDDGGPVYYQNVSWTIPGGVTAPADVRAPTVSQVRWNGVLQNHPSNDATAGLWVQPGRVNPSSWPQFFHPVSVSFADVQVDAEFVESGGPAVTAILGAPGTDLPEWRPWLGVGTLGKSDPAFNPDLAGRTKHSSGPAWGWGSHGYAQIVALRGGEEPGGRDVTLRVHGVHLAIDDPHTTGSHRGENFSVTETPYYVDYPLTFGPALNGLDLDLMLPVRVNGQDVAGAARQFYHGRVDKIEFIATDGKQLLLSGIVFTLKARGSTYLKIGYGAPVQRGDYSSGGLSNGAACAQLMAGDAAQRSPEDSAGIAGATGGNLRYVHILTGEPSGIIQDTQLSLEAFVAQFDALEGVTASYDATVFNAANQDNYEVALGSGTAQCLAPLLPNAVFGSGDTYQPPCCWLANRVMITNGTPYHIGTYHVVGGAIEALIGTTDSVGRANHVIVMAADGYPESARACDDHGYVAVYPVRPNSGSGLGLTPATAPGSTGSGIRLTTTVNVRDCPRVGAFVVLPGGKGVANLCTNWGWYFRANVQEGRVWVRRARWFIPPFDAEKAASPGPQDAHPALVRDHTERLWVLWQHDGGVSAASSDDDAETWSSPTVLFAGAKYPRVAACPVTGFLAYAAYAGGAIVFRVQAPGDNEPQTQRTITGFGTLADEPFDVRWDRSAERRLVFVVSTGSAIQEYVCTNPEDEAPSVKLVT